MHAVVTPLLGTARVHGLQICPGTWVTHGKRIHPERRVPERLPQPEHPGHFEVRLVSRNGGIRWKKGWVNISSSLIEEYVGLEEIDDGIWSLYFGPVLLGRFHEDNLTLHGARPG